MSDKLSNLADLAGAQVPTDLAYVVDLSAGVNGSKKSSLNDLLSIITKNITDGALRFGEFAAPSLSAAGQGAIYYDATLDKLMVSENGGPYFELNNVVNLFTNATSGTNVGNTAVETTLFTGMTGSAGSSLTIPANTSKIGTTYKMRFSGAYASGVGQTGRYRLKLGGTTVVDTGAVVLQNTGNAIYIVTVDVQVRALSGAGSCFIDSFRAELGSSVLGAQTITTIYATGVTAIDFTANQAIDLTFQWGAAAPGNTLLMTGVDIKRVR